MDFFLRFFAHTKTEHFEINLITQAINNMIVLFTIHNMTHDMVMYYAYMHILIYNNGTFWKVSSLVIEATPAGHPVPLNIDHNRRTMLEGQIGQSNIRSIIQ